MRTRRSQEHQKKREEKLITAELKMKYATYIDLIPDLKDMPYFDLLFVQRESRPLPASERIQNTIIPPKRFALNKTNTPSTPSTTSLSPVVKIEDRVATLKRTWSSSNLSEVSTSSSSVETSEDEGECRRSVVRREFTSTVSTESLKLTFKLKQPPRHRLTSSSSESSIDSTHSNRCHHKHSPCQQFQKGVRSSARLRGNIEGCHHLQHGLTSKLISKRNRIIIKKKCTCCH